MIDDRDISLMELPTDVFNLLYDEECTGECSCLCDSCKDELCKSYGDYIPNAFIQDGYNNVFVASCDRFTGRRNKKCL